MRQRSGTECCWYICCCGDWWMTGAGTTVGAERCWWDKFIMLFELSPIAVWFLPTWSKRLPNCEPLKAPNRAPTPVAMSLPLPLPIWEPPKPPSAEPANPNPSWFGSETHALKLKAQTAIADSFRAFFKPYFRIKPMSYYDIRRLGEGNDVC